MATPSDRRLRYDFRTKRVSWFESIVVFFLAWWLAFLCVLPWGVRPSETPEEGHEPGAPDRPRLWMKALVTTGIALVLWAIAYLIVDSGLISFRAMVDHSPY